MRTDLLEHLAEAPLVGDGAMGTMLYSKGVYINRCYDEVILTAPELVRDVHRAYIQAGSELIQTNTFGANPLKLEKHGLDALTEEILKPIDNFEKNKEYTTAPDVNPEYIRAKQFMYRLQKIMDEYAGGVSSQFKTSDKLLEKGLELLAFLREDSDNLAADGLHDLMRCWEAYHRMHQAEAHVRSILFREETRWPGYYFRADKPSIDQANWLAFCNCKYDKNTGEWEMIKRPVKYLTQ